MCIRDRFKAKVIEGFQDCYDIAGSVPQSVLDKNPLSRQFGRHMLFFKCAKVRQKNLDSMRRYLFVPTRTLINGCYLLSSS